MDSWNSLSDTSNIPFSNIDWAPTQNIGERNLDNLLIERSEQDENFYNNQETLYTKNVFNDLYNDLKNNLDKIELDEVNFTSLSSQEKDDIEKDVRESIKELDSNLIKFKETMVGL